MGRNIFYHKRHEQHERISALRCELWKMTSVGLARADTKLKEKRSYLKRDCPFGLMRKLKERQVSDQLFA